MTHTRTGIQSGYYNMLTSDENHRKYNYVYEKNRMIMLLSLQPPASATGSGRWGGTWGWRVANYHLRVMKIAAKLYLCSWRPAQCKKTGR